MAGQIRLVSSAGGGCANPSASSATDADIEEVIEIVSSGTELARLVVDDPDGVVAAALAAGAAVTSSGPTCTGGGWDESPIQPQREGVSRHHPPTGLRNRTVLARWLLSDVVARSPIVKGNS